MKFMAIIERPREGEEARKRLSCVQENFKDFKRLDKGSVCQLAQIYCNGLQKMLWARRRARVCRRCCFERGQLLKKVFRFLYFIWVELQTYFHLKFYENWELAPAHKTDLEHASRNSNEGSRSEERGELKGDAHDMFNVLLISAIPTGTPTNLYGTVH